MRILAFLTDLPVVSAILLHLDLPHRPPPVAPARGPGHHAKRGRADFLFDQTPAFDPSGAEPGPDLDFDQSLAPGLDD